MLAVRPDRRLLGFAVPVLLVAAALACMAARAPSAAASVLFSQSFHDNTVDGTAGTVSAPAATTGKTNAVCLSASGNPTANPLASCGTSTDSPGPGCCG